MSKSPIIVALDYDSAEEALELVDRLHGAIDFFKVGKQLFTRTGPEIVRQLRGRGVEVFLDLKFHDIPETVRKAVRSCVDLEVRFLTIHTSGGSEMMKYALQGAEGSKTEVLGVTVLTSMNEEAIREVGVNRSISDQVLSLATLAVESGLKGLVCSPYEVKIIREKVSKTVTLVTPGIRGLGEEKGDQKRTLSAAEAIQKGSTYLVIGRPITQAQDPVEAAHQIITSISTRSFPVKNS